MSDNVNLIDDEVPAYKKKSKKKGQPRSDHKHTYETVLLISYFHYNIGEPRVSERKQPTKVCTICGRIDDVDYDESLYDVRPDSNLKGVFVKDLSEKALSLPKWCADFFDKFAIKMESDEN